MFNFFKNQSKKIELISYNLINFLDKVKSKNIILYNLKKIDNKTLIFEISSTDYILLKNTCKIGYTFKEIDIVGFAKLNKLLKSKIGLFIGFFLSLFFLLIFNQFTFNYKIYGLEKIDENRIIEILQQENIKLNRINNVDVNKVQQKLVSQIDEISMVSVIKKGTTIIVNVKEKLEKINENYQPIFADYNMIITKLDVFAGTTNLKVGDSIFKGDVIVHPITFDGNGNAIATKPVANIEAKTWFIESETITKQSNIFIRTGKTVETSFYKLGTFNLWKIEKDNHFQYYEKIIKEKKISSFLPLSLISIVYYELEEQIIDNNFDDVEHIINELKIKAYKKVPLNVLILNEKVVELVVDNKKIITVYLEADIVFKGE